MSAPRHPAAPPPARPIRWVGTQGFLVECASLEDVMAVHAHLTAHPERGQRQVMAAAATVLVTFTSQAAAEHAAPRVSTLTPDTGELTGGRIVEIPVVYDGEDLAEVGRLTGLGVDGVIRAHSEADWFAAFGGFAPGFMYCASEAAPFEAPRRSSPRTAVPAGAVAVAGAFSAVYPRTSPGGWQLLGHTTAALWDLGREQPALLQPGDRVRYVPVRPTASVTSGTDAAVDATPPADAAAGLPSVAGRRGVTVVDPGLLTLVQDLGRPGLGDLGVVASGAADRDAARQANRLVGNRSREAVLETVLGGLTLTAHGHQVMALAGAEAGGTITAADGAARRVPARSPFVVLDGQTLTVDEPVGGLRVYVGLRGGLDVPPVLGSRSTDTLSGLGPAPLRAGDRLARRVGPSREVAGVVMVGDPEAALRPMPAPGQTAVVRVVPGPRDDWFGEAGLERLFTQDWDVSQQTDRIGVRLTAPDDGVPLERVREGELKSEGAVRGALQVPPSGEPVLFLSDHPVTGGYPVIGVVARADLSLAAQLPPGARVRFVPHPRPGAETVLDSASPSEETPA
ncbi:5-oxoprolinase subunit B/C family protein [Micrococcus aloeverae]